MDKNNSLVVNTVYPSKENDKFFLLQDDYKELKMSTRFKLVIKNTDIEDMGFYNCTIGNGLGNSFFGFEVKQKSIFKIFSINKTDFFILQAKPINAQLTLALIIIFSILIIILVLSIFLLVCMQRIRKEKVIKSLPNVSDHSEYEHNDKSTTQQYQVYTCENAVFKEISKNLSDVNLI